MTRLAVSYLKDHWKGVFLLAVCSGIFLLVFYLEQLPLDAVAYCVLLCFCTGLVLWAWDFIRYAGRHSRLKLLRKTVLVDGENLPEPQSLLESDYQELLKREREERMRIEDKEQQARQEMVDYYTMWAHQIKTPIAAMRLLLSEDSAHDRELLSELFKVEQYVGMVLSYLRLNGDSTDFVIRRYPLEPIVRHTVRKYAPLFIRKKIGLELLDVDCTVLTDEKWLSFVIEQLLSNALKYTNKGKITIYMEQPKTLIIEDTGIGIAPEDLPRICERGFTGYNGRTDKAATGIGLYLCREILYKLSHTLNITSEPGKGTQVRLGLDFLDIRLE